jgi:predicted aconitase
MFHAVGDHAGGPPPGRRRCRRWSASHRADDLRGARWHSRARPVGAAIGAVSIGTPHCSVREFGQLAAWSKAAARVPFYVNTDATILAQAEREERRRQAQPASPW